MSAYSMAGTLDTLKPYIPEALISAGALADLRRVFDRLPADLGHEIYLECRLTEEAHRVDTVILVGEAGRAMLAGEHPQARLPLELQDHAAWERLTSFCRQWADPRSPIHEAIDHIWLEFDVEPVPAPEVAALPGVFVHFSDLQPGCFRTPSWQASAEAALRALSQRPLPAATEASLAHCLRRLPANACVPYLGLMPHRTPPALRLCVTKLRDEQVGSYLEAVGWPGDVPALAELMDSLGTVATGEEGCPRFGMLHLDIDGGVSSRVGLEYVFPRGTQIKGCGREPALLDLLTERGLCSAAKRDGLLAWAGASFERFPHEFWRSTALRLVNHVKVVYRDGLAPEAKGYLVTTHWL